MKLIKALQSKLKENSFARNVAIMFGGTVLGQATAILLSPILTRLYTPDEFGILGAFSAGLMILSVLGAMRYEMALPLTKTKEGSANLLAVCFITLILTTGMFSFFLLGIHTIEPWPVLAELKPYAVWLPIGFAAIAAYQVMVFLATREDSYGDLAKTKIAQGVSGPVSQMIMGFFGAGPIGLLLGFIIGQSMGVSLLVQKLVLKTKLFAALTKDGMVYQAKRFKRFPLISSWSGLISFCGGTTGLLVAVPILYPLQIAGFVFLIDRIIGRPLMIISTSVMQVYIGDISKSAEAEPSKMRARFLSIALKQGLVVLGWLIIVNLLAPFFFPIIFGVEWGGAVPYVLVLSIAYLFQMTMHSLVHTLQVMEQQGLSMIWETFRFVLVMCAFSAMYFLELDAVTGLLIYSAMQAIANMTLFFIMLASINKIVRNTK